MFSEIIVEKKIDCVPRGQWSRDSHYTRASHCARNDVMCVGSGGRSSHKWKCRYKNAWRQCNSLKRCNCRKVLEGLVRKFCTEGQNLMTQVRFATATRTAAMQSMRNMPFSFSVNYFRPLRIVASAVNRIAKYSVKLFPADTSYSANSFYSIKIMDASESVYSDKITMSFNLEAH